MYIPPLFVQSSVDGHRSGFNHLAVVNNASRNRDVWISLGDSASFNSFFFFWCGPFLKSLLNLVRCFMFWFFDWEARGTFTPQPGGEPARPALEGEVLTTGLPRSLEFARFFWSCCETCRILVPQTGIEPGPRKQKCWLLTTNPSGNSGLQF